MKKKRCFECNPIMGLFKSLNGSYKERKGTSLPSSTIYQKPEPLRTCEEGGDDPRPMPCSPMPRSSSSAHTA